MNDTTPPAVRLQTRIVKRGAAVRVAVTDAQSGVDPRTLAVPVDGHAARFSFHNGVLLIPTTALGTGTHRLTVRASDYEESKNMEDVGPVLPNTRTLATTFAVRFG